jgi:type I restriction enzyme M protein
MAKKLSEQRAREVTRELLAYRDWDLRPVSSNGQVLEENEYKNYPTLESIFEGKSKTGPGSGKPDFLLIESSDSLKPLVVIDTKASSAAIKEAIKDGNHYGNACIEAGIEVLSVGVAGAEKEICSVKVQRIVNGVWKDLTLHGQPIDWIPSPKQTANILLTKNRLEVEPERPPESVLAAQANKLNELLRECKIKDEYRPTYVATFMLALWKGDVSTEKDVVLTQINANAEQALQKAGKPELAHSLRVDDENDTLASRAWEIVDILKKLNIRSFMQEHDYLGQLYETFFRYTGGNTIGQYFTPRHIISLMCDIVDIMPDDIIFDPACGTGGFLIGALNRMIRKKGIPYEEGVKKIKNNLFGIESEPATAALCITNMILRGDGKSGVIKANCFTKTKYPKKEADCSLMNPPFPHKKTDTPATNFIDRALKSLRKRGMLATIIPYSLLVKIKDWHKKIIKENSIIFIATLPPDLFNPYASYNTAVLVILKGVPHNNKSVFLARISNDGFKIKKNSRVPQEGSQLDTMMKAFSSKSDIPELCTNHQITIDSKEWSPEAFIKNAPRSDQEFVDSFEEHIREQASFYIRFGHRILPKNIVKTFGTQSAPTIFSIKSSLSFSSIIIGNFKVSQYFDVELGGKDEIEDLEEGDVPIVSTSEYFNGVTAWRKPNKIYQPPVITVATDGSTCSSFVQEYPFYTFYKDAILHPKIPVPVDALYFIAYLLKRERWRYVYARKFGKYRIENTILFAPSKNGKPDFDKMAELTQNCVSFPIIKSFRDAYESLTTKKI